MKLIQQALNTWISMNPIARLAIYGATLALCVVNAVLILTH